MIRRMRGVLAACGLLAGLVLWPQQGRAAAPLVQVRYTGGLCVGGPCDARYVLYADGRYRGPRHAGTLRPAALAAVRRAIDRTDFAALRARPFRGTCPTAYDGQEVQYAFATRRGVQTLDSCKEALPASPLLTLVDGLARGS